MTLSVGEILKRERFRKKISLKDVEKNIRVREKFLVAIEQNDWKPFSSKVYISGVIRSYSLFLGLDENRVLAFFRRDYDAIEDVRFKEKVTKDYFTPQTKKIVILTVGTLIALFILYFGYQLNQFFSPPQLTIIEPTSNTVLQKERISIVGKTDREAAVSIFGERVYQDKDGIFRYDLPLKKGENRVTIEIVGANGKKAVYEKTFKKI